MGIECNLKEVFNFIYRVDLGNLIEYEFDHIFVGELDENPRPNRKEVEDWKWINLEKLKKDTKENPEKYTYWFKMILDNFNQIMKKDGSKVKLCSACLLGIRCRWDGKSKPNKKVIKLAKKGILIPVCPEQLGGLSTPRIPQEIQGCNGEDVLNKKGRGLLHSPLC